MPTAQGEALVGAWRLAVWTAAGSAALAGLAALLLLKPHEIRSADRP